jgi:hypothetical protein
MFFDEIIQERDNAKLANFSFADMVDCSIEVIESLCNDQAEIIALEAKNRLFGSEGIDEWWAKIKTFFRKIWETIKNYCAKLIVFVMTIPAKIGAFTNKIIAMWESRGIKKRIESLRSNFKDDLIVVKNEEKNAFEKKDWGIQEPEAAAQKAKILISVIFSIIDKFESESDITVASIKSMVAAAIASKCANNASGTAGIASIQLAKSIPDYLSAEDYEKFGKKIAKVIGLMGSAMSNDSASEEKEHHYELSSSNLEIWYSSVKDGGYEKAAKKYLEEMKKLNKEIEDDMKRRMNMFESAYKDKDEDKVSGLVNSLKALRAIITSLAVTNGTIGNKFAKMLVNRTKMINAAAAIFIGSKDLNRKKSDPPPADSSPKDNGKPKPSMPPVSDGNPSMADVSSKYVNSFFDSEFFF